MIWTLARFVTFTSIALAAASGCTVSTSPAPPGPTSTFRGDGGTSATATPRVKPRTTPKTGGLKKLAGATPPSGAQPKGAQTRPRVGAVTVPIDALDTYVVAADFDGDGNDEEVSWAYAPSGVTYLWLVAPVACADGASDADGAFLMAVHQDGSGTYLFSLAGCASSDLFGCDFDASGAETACGACSVSDESLVCAVAE